MKFLLYSVAITAFLKNEVTPTQKVIEMLEVMKAKGEREKHEETVMFATFKQFCEDTAVLKDNAIKQANRQIDSLRSSIAKYEADAKELARKVAAHETDIAMWESDKRNSAKVRENERNSFNDMDQHLTESIDAILMAKDVLQKENYRRKQAEKGDSAKRSTESVAALMQVQALIPLESRKVIDAFLQRDADRELGDDATHLAVQNPEAHGYSFQSQSVIDLLDKLHDKFAKERKDTRTHETQMKHDFEQLTENLSNEIDEANRQRNDKTQARAAKLQKKGEAEGTLADTIATRDDDQKYLSDMTANCETKAGGFEHRQQLRADELVAINKAVEIISGKAVSGHAAKHFPQDKSFLMLRSSIHGRKAPVKERVIGYLQDQGNRIHSRVLEALAVRVADDPLGKVKKMIKDLIVRLMEEATAEAEKQGWCQTELTGNEHTRKQKTRKVELLHATIDQTDTSVKKLSEDITNLTSEITELDKAVAEAIDIRQKEKEKNKVTVAESQEAQKAVASALAVLQEFYAQAAEATALLEAKAHQSQQPEAPAIFDSPYKGMQGENGGVIGMLEVIEGDFARLEADTQSAENQSAKDHQKFLDDAEVDKAQKQKDIEHKSANRDDQKNLLAESRQDLVGTNKELDAANAYYETLKGQCIANSGNDYKERAQRRQDEIESLQEAVRILKGEDFQ